MAVLETSVGVKDLRRGNSGATKKLGDDARVWNARGAGADGGATGRRCDLVGASVAAGGNV